MMGAISHEGFVMLQHTSRLTLSFAVAAMMLLSGAAIAADSDSGPIPTSGSTDAMLKTAVAGSWRSDANKARNQYRHPVKTLEFFGIKPDMTVIELSPAGGWYTEVLAPFLYAHGHLIEAAAPMDSKSKFMSNMAKNFAAKLKADSKVYGHIEKVIPFSPPAQVTLGPENSADMVLTFRNTHDWMNNGPETLAKVFTAAFAALKPGGVFGVVEHRAKPFADARISSGQLHRLPEDYMIDLGLKTGFRLDGVSQINRNAKDSENVNVHRLPPSLNGPDSEHAKMKAIGESDRMTLKFVKP